jgi:cysteine synthase
MAFVALITDAASRYAHVYVPAQTWKEVIDILEAGGCEVIEDQSDDYEPEDLASEKAMNEIGVMTVDQLLKQSNFIAYP